MTKLLKKLKKALKNISDFEDGKLTLTTEFIEIPEPPKSYKPKEIKKIREERNYSQGLFAKALNVSPKTVQSWESGLRKPAQASLRLLELVDKGIYKPIHKR